MSDGEHLMENNTNRYSKPGRVGGESSDDPNKAQPMLTKREKLEQKRKKNEKKA